MAWAIAAAAIDDEGPVKCGLRWWWGWCGFCNPIIGGDVGPLRAPLKPLLPLLPLLPETLPLLLLVVLPELPLPLPALPLFPEDTEPDDEELLLDLDDFCCCCCCCCSCSCCSRLCLVRRFWNHTLTWKRWKKNILYYYVHISFEIIHHVCKMTRLKTRIPRPTFFHYLDCIIFFIFDYL